MRVGQEIMIFQSFPCKPTPLFLSWKPRWTPTQLQKTRPNVIQRLAGYFSFVPSAAQRAAAAGTVASSSQLCAEAQSKQYNFQDAYIEKHGNLTQRKSKSGELKEACSQSSCTNMYLSPMPCLYLLPLSIPPRFASGILFRFIGLREHKLLVSCVPECLNPSALQALHGKPIQTV